MSHRLVSISTDDVKTTSIIFIDEKDKHLGSVKIENGKFIFDPANLNVTVVPDGQKHGDYLYWDSTIPSSNNANGSWVAIGDKIHIGNNAGQNTQGDFAVAIGNDAGQNNQGDYAIAVGNSAGQSGQPNNTIILNATGIPVNGLQENALYIAPVREEIRQGVTGNFMDDVGVISSQSTNVLSYNKDTKETTLRDLGLYNDTISSLSQENSETDTRKIVSNFSIVPKIQGFIPDGSSNKGLNLGHTGAYWNSIYAKSIYTTTGTIYVTDPETQSTMAVKFNPTTLTTTLSNDTTTIENVTSIVYNQTVSDFNDYIKKLENRFLALEEYVINMQKTYNITKPSGENFVFHGVRQSGLLDENIQITPKYSNGVYTGLSTISISEYVYNILYNTIKIYDSNDNFIILLDKNDFIIQDLQSRFRTVDVIVSTTKFPISIKVCNLSDEVILDKTFSF